MVRAKQAALPQAKLIRLLNLIALLKVKPMRIEEIAERYDVSKRTAYRYLEILDLCEMIVEKDFHDRFFVVEVEKQPDTAKNGYVWYLPKII